MPKITLKAARINAGYKQTDVAKKLNITAKTVCSWETGKTYPDQPMIEALCKLYGVTYDVLNFEV